MKVEIDILPVTNDRKKPDFIVRLYPENNKDMTDMEWGLEVMSNQVEVIKAGHTSAYNYAFIFKNKEKQ